MAGTSLVSVNARLYAGRRRRNAIAMVCSLVATFIGLGWLVLRRNPAGDRLVMAVAIEAAWELIENSDHMISRYREATIALGYTGDSILNSVMDIGWMLVGFYLARRLPVSVTVALAVGLELLALWAIRDNLTLNVLMLAWPIEAIKDWQAGA